MNAVYGKAKQALLSAGINLLTDNIKVALLNAGYVVNLAVHQYVSDLTNILVRSANLASKSVSLGVFSAANPTFTAVTGAAVDFIVIYKDTGTDSSSPLIFYIDTSANLPITPNGTDITVAWDTGANKIFAL